MRTRNSYYPNNSPVTIPRRRNRRRAPNVVEPELRTIVEVAPMADNRTMEELLQAPTEGYGEAIVIPEINADHFEIKTNLLQLVQASPFHGFERDNPHTHINNFKRITSTLKFRGVPNDVIKLMMFPYSLEGAARIWYDKEPPNSILTWDDLVNKFVNQFFPPSKTTHLKNEISRFTQKFDETFGEAWERFKEMLRACPHHGFSELTQIDTFYNGLNDNDQDSLNAAAGGNLLSKTTREALNIIENKSKVRYSRNKSNVSRVNTNSRESSSKTDERIDKLADQISTLVEIVSKKVVTPATVKEVEEICVTCGGPHAYYNCPNTDSNQSNVCAATGTYNQVAPPNRVSNHMAPPDFALVQNSQNRYNQNQGQGNNFNRGNNFHGNQVFQAPTNHAPNFQNQGFQNQVLEQGHWMIRNTPIILNKWTPNLSLGKDKVTSVPVWVKLHKVPIVAYTEDGLSLIASQIGKPVMLDAFTCAMCNDPWGRIGFARALIEVSAAKELKKEVTMAVPNEDGTAHTKVCIQAEYEWKPPLCTECHVFGHTNAQCPKSVKEAVTVNEEVQADGFTTVSNRKRKGKKQGTNNWNKQGGIKLNKPKTFEYRHVAAQTADKPVKQVVTVPVTTTNHFEVLNDEAVRLVNEGETSGSNMEEGLFSNQADTKVDSDSEVEETFVVQTLNHKGASTHSNDVFND
ncbi:reverse transcriptase domain-containing protein [Tanacetum coccineum]